MKIWEIYHYTYGNIVDDTYFGKKSSFRTIGFVTDTEDNIKSLINKLNEYNHSYYAKNEPKDEYDEDFVDEDYISYKEVKIETLEEIENRFKQ